MKQFSTFYVVSAFSTFFPLFCWIWSLSYWRILLNVLFLAIYSYYIKGRKNTHWKFCMQRRSLFISGLHWGIVSNVWDLSLGDTWCQPVTESIFPKAVSGHLCFLEFWGRGERARNFHSHLLPLSLFFCFYCSLFAWITSLLFSVSSDCKPTSFPFREEE